MEDSDELIQDEIRNTFLIPTSKHDDQKFEFIFMLDVSQSMRWRPIKLAKEALLLFLQSLPEDCYFNVLTFRKQYRTFFPKSVKYCQETLESAKKKISEVKASGGSGTELLKPLTYIYEQPQNEGYLTQIFTLTDGKVLNTQDVLSLVKSKLIHSRSFTMGIGNNVDRNLVIGMAENAGGMYEFVTYNEPIETKILSMLKMAQKPALLKPIRVPSASRLTHLSEED